MLIVERIALIYNSKLNNTFYGGHQYPRMTESHTPIWVSNGRAKHDPLDSPSIEDKSSKNARYIVIYRVEILGHIPKPYWDLSYSGLWGLRCEQSPDTSSRCDTPIFYKVEMLGGANGYIS